MCIYLSIFLSTCPPTYLAKIFPGVLVTRSFCAGPNSGGCSWSSAGDLLTILEKTVSL